MVQITSSSYLGVSIGSLDNPYKIIREREVCEGVANVFSSYPVKKGLPLYFPPVASGFPIGDGDAFPHFPFHDL
ncbi:hypothetical protein B296_00022913 [Ensete ventricosum]|uniref:Uncharacterized protein n=1 Tax=Ensete ventricosum TaxID=4639 RepID=A0A426Y9C4_ENSVE|nr:hypothetical protein B296_00022913 [Ensete ventricosum]